MGIGEQQNLGQRTEGSKIWDGRFKGRTIAQNDQLARYLSVSERAGNDAPPIKGVSSTGWSTVVPVYVSPR